MPPRFYPLPSQRMPYQAVNTLRAVLGWEGRYDIAYDEVAELQLRATAELFAERGATIRALDMHAADNGIEAVREPSDLVGLLFAHTAYKSFPETWLR